MFHLGSQLVSLEELHIPRFGGVLQVCGDFTWRVVSMDWITGGDFGKKFRRIRKEDKLNYKI